ncbi:hypothetical protein ABW19_dt0210093 [Dactylella cylindrospora]|nr:hypothetical protein ABW19_dt0210093 [Dactylella cylindrospora]
MSTQFTVDSSPSLVSNPSHPSALASILASTFAVASSVLPSNIELPAYHNTYDVTIPLPEFEEDEETFSFVDDVIGSVRAVANTSPTKVNHINYHFKSKDISVFEQGQIETDLGLRPDSEIELEGEGSSMADHDETRGVSIKFAMAHTFKDSVSEAYKKLLEHGNSPIASEDFKEFANSWSGTEEIVRVGALAIETLSRDGKGPTDLREAYSILHVAYAMSQCDVVSIPLINSEQLYRDLRRIKTEIPSSERDLFDEIAIAMAEEFRCALTWMRKHKLDAFLGSADTQQEAPSLSEWLRTAERKARMKEALSLNDYGKDPPMLVNPKDLDNFWSFSHTVHPHTQGELAATLLYKGIQMFSQGTHAVPQVLHENPR